MYSFTCEEVFFFVSCLLHLYGYFCTLFFVNSLQTSIGSTKHLQNVFFLHENAIIIDRVHSKSINYFILFILSFRSLKTEAQSLG